MVSTAERRSDPTALLSYGAQVQLDNLSLIDHFLSRGACRSTTLFAAGAGRVLQSILATAAIHVIVI